MINTVYLQDISSDDFKELCRQIFSIYYGVPVEGSQLVNDKGHYITIHSNDGEALVECKHQPNASIGKSIVQKLHSAMITGNMKKGIIVTTGSFSSDAIKYVSENLLPIDLMDIHSLKTISTSVGYHLISERDESSNALYIEPSSDDVFKIKMVAELKKSLFSSPIDLMQLVNIDERKIIFESYYQVKYSIDAEFSTSVGLVHSEKSSGTMFVRERDGQFMVEKVSEFYARMPKTIYSSDSNINFEPIEKIMPRSVFRDMSVDRIIKQHSKVVSYRGKNNQVYRKECVPLKKDIFINDITQVFLPFSEIRYTILKKQRSLICAEGNDGNFVNMGTPLHVCDICNAPIKNQGVICSHCGNMAEMKKHGRICSICKCSLCINCAEYYRKCLLIKKPICHKCSMIDPKLKVRKYNTM